MLNVSKNPFKFFQIKPSFILQKSISIRKYKPCHAITLTRDDDDSNEDDTNNKKKSYENIDPERIQTIHNLNKIFYYDYTISYEELKDLIIGTFKKLYRIKLEVREGQICFVVYPEILSTDDIEYKREMDAIAMVLTDYAMKDYLYNEIKKINIFQRDIVVIPLQIDLQQK